MNKKTLIIIRNFSIALVIGMTTWRIVKGYQDNRMTISMYLQLVLLCIIIVGIVYEYVYKRRKK